jgi:hypothetical protein
MLITEVLAENIKDISNPMATDNNADDDDHHLPPAFQPTAPDTRFQRATGGYCR